MGKRSNFNEKRPRDLWPTIDTDAVKSLIPYVKGQNFAEPCCGGMDLADMLTTRADMRCTWASDLEPQTERGDKLNALNLTENDVKYSDLIITNPPFAWKMLEPLLAHFPALKPTWLLLPADIIHNKRMAPYMRKCGMVVAVGRLYWQPNKIKGVDNYVWLYFPQQTTPDFECATVFVGRS